MQCTACKHENPADSRFCGGCGAKLAETCPSCHHVNPADSRFCNKCSATLGQAPASTPSARFSTPQDYTPRHLVEKILSSRQALEGERKQVTVLFADMKSSLELLADRDPEEARQIIDPVVERMMEAVHRYEGTVNQIMGDGIMALFGAPLAHEEHAVRACFAALAMQVSIRQYSEELRSTHGAEVQIRIGLHSGEVVVRSISNDLRLEYSAIGQTTHLAARMEQLAPPGHIRLTAETLRLAEGYIQVDPLGPIPVKGMPRPVEVYDLVGASSLRSRVQVAAARGLTRFVGRRSEMDAVAQALERSASGRGEIVALVGEPGVGKSRLVWEFTHSHRTRDWLILEAGSVSYGKATPYRPLIDLLKAYFHVDDRDDARRVREKITGKLLTLDKTLDNTLNAFLSLLDLPVEDVEWQQLHPTLRRQRILEACKRLMLRESMVQPLLVVFEDLHWVDGETQAFLDSLTDSLPTSKILLLVNYRPEYKQNWVSKTYYTQLHIAPLPPESAEELLTGLLGDTSDLQQLRELLILRTEGNPLFLEESVRSLVESGALVGERGNYQLATDIGAIEVPTRIQPLIAARIDRLAPEAKLVLQAAAVIGKDFPYLLLKGITGVTEEDLHKHLAQLQGSDFLYETNLFPDIEFTFKHALTHEVAYGSILQERRRLIHAQIVDAMESLYGSRLAEHAERLGQHALRGELWPKAVIYLQQAGAKSLSRSINAEAVSYYEQTLEALTRLPNDADASCRIVDMQIELRNALHPLGEFDRALDILERARKLAQSLGDDRRLARVNGFIAQSHRVRGDYPGAAEAGLKAKTIGDDLSDLSILATAHYHLGQIYFQLGAHDEAIAFHRRNIELIDGTRVKERLGMAGLPAAFSRGHMAWSLAEQGNFQEAFAMSREAVQIAADAKHPFTQAFAVYSVGLVHLRKGEIAGAIEELEAGMQLCKSMNIRLDLPYVRAFLGCAYVHGGRVEEGIALLAQARQSAASLKLVASLSWLAILMGEAEAATGDYQAALTLADEALERAQALGEAGFEGWALRLKAEVALSSDNPDLNVAHAYFERAMEVARELGMRPLEARSGLGLGQVHRLAGRKDQARSFLTSAIEQFQGIGMELWCGSAERELSLL